MNVLLMIGIVALAVAGAVCAWALCAHAGSLDDQEFDQDISAW